MQLFIANKNYSSWSLRPWVLMRGLGIAFDETLVPFGDSNWAQFRAFSPTGQVPCLVDGAIRIWESLAIVEYLAERDSRAWPADASARAWARCAAAEMHAGFAALRSSCSLNIGVRIRLAAVSPALRRDLERIDELWAEGLARFGGPFLAGPRFTAVDAFYAPVAFRIRTYSPPVAPATREHAERLLALPALRRWEREALAETTRDAAHEEQLPRLGELIEDRRAVAG